MGNDSKLSENERTCIRVSISITPAHEPRGDLPGLLGNVLFDLSSAAGLSRQTSSKANVQLIEMLTDVVEHGLQLHREMSVEFAIYDDDVTLDVRAPDAFPNDKSTDSWFPEDEPTLTAPTPTLKTMRRSKKDLLAETVQERRVDSTKGGLGLMRLRSGARKRSDGGGNNEGGGDDGGSSPAPANAVIPFPKKP